MPSCIWPAMITKTTPTPAPWRMQSARSSRRWTFPTLTESTEPMSLPQTPARPDHGPARIGGPDSAPLAAEPEPEPSPGAVAPDLAPPQLSTAELAADPSPASAPREAPARRLLGRILKTLVPLAPGDDEQGPDSMMEAATSAE